MLCDRMHDINSAPHHSILQSNMPPVSQLINLFAAWSCASSPQSHFPWLSYAYGSQKRRLQSFAVGTCKAWTWIMTFCPEMCLLYLFLLLKNTFPLLNGSCSETLAYSLYITITLLNCKNAANFYSTYHSCIILDVPKSKEQADIIFHTCGKQTC